MGINGCQVILGVFIYVVVWVWVFHSLEVEIGEGGTSEIPNLLFRENPPCDQSRSLYPWEPFPSSNCTFKQKDLDERIRLYLTRKMGSDIELSDIESYFPLTNTSILRLPLPLIWIHIPKTAGSSLGEVFRESGKTVVEWGATLSPVHEVMALDSNYIIGHYQYGIHKVFEEVHRCPCSYGTMFRDPIERVISHYWYYKQNWSDRCHVSAMSHSIEDWLQFSLTANNAHTQFILGYETLHITEEMFKEAKRNVEEMPFVGITERWKETILLMKRFFGVSDGFDVHVKKGTLKPSNSANDTIRELIRERNLYDYQLYDIALEKFERELRMIGEKNI